MPSLLRFLRLRLQNKVDRIAFILPFLSHPTKLSVFYDYQYHQMCLLSIPPFSVPVIVYIPDWLDGHGRSGRTCDEKCHYGYFAGEKLEIGKLERLESGLAPHQ